MIPGIPHEPRGATVDVARRRARTSPLVRRLLPSLWSGLVMAAIGALGWASGVPWLFPSLGPTIAIQSRLPAHRTARPWNVVVGHFIGAAVGFAAVRITGVIHEPAVNLTHALTGPRILAAALAVTFSMALQELAGANHAPAQATTLLIVVGALDADLKGAFVLAAGIVLVAVLGEVVRRMKLSQRAGV